MSKTSSTTNGTTTTTNGAASNNASSAPSNTAKTVATSGIEHELDMAIQGIATLIPSTLSLPFDGQVVTQPDMLRKGVNLQALYQTRRDLKTQLKIVQNQIESYGNSEAQRFVSATRVTATAFLGQTNPELATFGFKPRAKRVPLTVEQKTAAVAKAKATRKARSTMGARQKAAIHGVVTATPTAPETTTMLLQAKPATPPVNAPLDASKKAV